MNHFLCIHGHFYQPPRENPWLEEIEIQDSAHPYQDWNERITAECYYPNTSSRIHDEQGRIKTILNNYSKISFNFGPTLFSWLERKAPEVYHAILEADKESMKFFSGHGSAIAQVYNHMIMPLANERDKRTQVLWGIEDFQYRFKREPEGMWLAETAVDVPTLEILAECGIKFTILSPYQAARVRQIGSQNWQDVSNGSVETKHTYLCVLPSGRSISLFFYDGQLARDVAFGDLLKDGARFTQRIKGSFKQEDWPQLVHVATDGETYGHHHKFGNMALSFLLNNIDKDKQVNLTNYGEFLEKFSPKLEAEIRPNTSWSCDHGVERWRSDCGCCIGGHPGWNQKWRKPLKEGMDYLRDKLAPLFEREMLPYVNDPWKMRDDFIKVILDRDEKYTENFIKNFAKHDLDQKEKVKILSLLEMQRHAMLMYTSCGWFFDDIAGIEPMQTLEYAARAIQLAKEITGVDLENDYLNILERAVSNDPQMGTGKDIYKKYIIPEMIDLPHVAAHFAISSLFERFPKTAKIYSYEVFTERLESHKQGHHKLLTGRARIRSEVTHQEMNVSFVVIHWGAHDLHAWVCEQEDDRKYEHASQEVVKVFQKAEVDDVHRTIERLFGKDHFSFVDLFKNEQSKALEHIFETALNALETHLREIYEQYSPLFKETRPLRRPFPKALEVAVDYIAYCNLIDLLQRDDTDVIQLENFVKEIIGGANIRDKEKLSLVAGQRVDTLMSKLFNNIGDIILLETIEQYVKHLSSLELDWDLWRIQDTYFRIGKKFAENRSKINDQEALKRWSQAFERLGKYLKVRIVI
jgi:alpha-amylase/alpha-mannosidase (GH57 family)